MSEKSENADAVEVTDCDIQEIVDHDEAGVADLIAAYAPVERSYFSAVTPQPPTVAYSTNTNFSAVVQKESSGDPRARNRSSGAFGLGQLLDATSAATRCDDHRPHESR